MDLLLTVLAHLDDVLMLALPQLAVWRAFL